LQGAGREDRRARYVYTLPGEPSPLLECFLGLLKAGGREAGPVDTHAVTRPIGDCPFLSFSIETGAFFKGVRLSNVPENTILLLQRILKVSDRLRTIGLEACACRLSGKSGTRCCPPVPVSQHCVHTKWCMHARLYDAVCSSLQNGDSDSS